MKPFKFSMLTLLFLIFIACDTDVPEVDNDPPSFSFKVTGDGFDRTFSQDDDLENLQLNLKHDARYEMLFSSADNGGVEHTTLRYDAQHIEFDNDPVFPAEPWTQAFFGLSFYVDWEGDRNNALTGNILLGSFKPNGENVSTSFTFYVRDFGGESNNSNTTTADLSIFIGDFDTEVITLPN
ncbi:hypothetical protein [Sediminibacter sp. Hel_I_10]|uniref:hypothetical protein n=1 Tax=Sediminibacter sp. Hel_I_10 TaxID=1392490 RepID=UPI00047DC038|nr:hypothetical protein [Sediminibacter sp. Hel_I_10]